MKPIPTIPVYICPECERRQPYNQWVHDPVKAPYCGLYCGDCGEEVKWDHDREASFVSVAVYEVDRAYGGPEEGGWYYDVGTRDNASLRCFPVAEWPQAQLYLEHAHREADQRGSRYCQMRASLYVDEVAPAGFPKHRPFYS